MVVAAAVFITTRQSIQMLEKMVGQVGAGLLNLLVLAPEEMEILHQHPHLRVIMAAHQVLSGVVLIVLEVVGVVLLERGLLEHLLPVQ